MKEFFNKAKNKLSRTAKELLEKGKASKTRVIAGTVLTSFTVVLAISTVVVFAQSEARNVNTEAAAVYGSAKVTELEAEYKRGLDFQPQVAEVNEVEEVAAAEAAPADVLAEGAEAAEVTDDQFAQQGAEEIAAVAEEANVEEVVTEEAYVEENNAALENNNTEWSEDEYTEEVVEDTSYEEAVPVNTDYYTAGDLRFNGVIYSGGWRWTYYSQRVLPGGGLNIPGRHVDENGFVCDGNNRICLASSVLGYGTVVSTPFGKEGCVYDSGCNADTLDVYTDF